ncbi:MAG: hypothetical protein JO320_15750 [Alphaproteobacteria bacterium]|nr:hypothetical protein [Alphaproteobacteria bacterium]MBV9251201.1 hypothetical protein [Acetobacteraceae bacterium]MBV9376486.1 hypothetical protein [Alphaproteobacteria bacterium]
MRRAICFGEFKIGAFSTLLCRRHQTPPVTKVLADAAAAGLTYGAFIAREI